MEVTYEGIKVPSEGHPESPRAVFRLAATGDSWRFSQEEIQTMLDGNREVRGVVFEENELQRGLAELQSLEL